MLDSDPMQRSLFPDQKAAASAPSRVNPRELNPAQLEAATTVNGPVLVIAGAGSGKTRTLVYRMAHLLEQGIAPESILLLTFTRKAAQEMLARAASLVDQSCQRVLGGTFHAVANLMLRRYGRHLGYEPNFTILDRADAEGIVNLLKSSLNLGGEGKRFPSKKMVADTMSRAVNKSLSLEAILEEEYPHLLEFLPDLRLLRGHYRQFKLEHGLMDYDDLLVNWKRVLEIPEIREQMSRRFTHIMVDEYQDTNRIQAEIVRLLAHAHDNVMVVGDDSQSIYSFRGADFRNIMDFPKLFPGTRIIRLEENYRSTQAILAVTNAVIDKAAEKYTKTLYSRIEGGEKPAIYAARDEGEQARFVAEKIRELHKEGLPLREMAVLFRSGFHSYKLELELANRQLPFEKRGGQKLTESAHIKDVLSYLRVTANPRDHLSWNRILLLIDKVGPKTASSLLDRIKAAEEPLTFLIDYPAGKSWRQGLIDLATMLHGLTEPGLAPAEQLERVLAYYQPVFERIYHDDYPKRSRDLEQLRAILAGYGDLQSFIDDTALDPPESAMDGSHAEPGDRLVLSTVHSAKGLEWDTVFIIHLAEGKFPSAQAVSPEEREEERRLLYVAATRARKQLYLLYPREVMTPDRMMARGTLSPFLAELPPDLTTGAGRPAPAPGAPRPGGGTPVLDQAAIEP
ncbi:MAG: ATP-dependent helicase, partial [Desulfobacteraceae bacterium]|nr:ATP-dependent helicase [Desulfobacteraceae bacterium]